MSVSGVCWYQAQFNPLRKVYELKLLYRKMPAALVPKLGDFGSLLISKSADTIQYYTTLTLQQ